MPGERSAAPHDVTDRTSGDLRQGRHVGAFRGGEQARAGSV